MIAGALLITGLIVGLIGTAMALASRGETLSVDGARGLRAWGILLTTVGTVTFIVSLFIGAIASGWFTGHLDAAIAAPLIIIGGFVFIVAGIAFIIMATESKVTPLTKAGCFIGAAIMAFGLMWGTLAQGWFQ